MVKKLVLKIWCYFHNDPLRSPVVAQLTIFFKIYFYSCVYMCLYENV